MLPSWYTDYRDLIENGILNFLDNYFGKAELSKPLSLFKESVYYSTKGGKKLRAIFALEFYLVMTGKSLKDISKNDDIIKFCIALEFVHSYSLVHDDLPAMDNDEYRRGELTTWKKFGEANAILVGDMLNTLGFEILSEISDKNLGIKLTNILSKSIGFFGMVGGQVEDLYFEKHFYEIDLNILLSLHKKKTGALIKTSIIGGVILSGKDDILDSVSKYSENIGLAFQIKDDILDETGTLETTGKSVGGEKKGFVHFYGLEKSIEVLNDLIDKSLDILSNFQNNDKLIFLTNYIKNRNK